MDQKNVTARVFLVFLEAFPPPFALNRSRRCCPLGKYSITVLTICRRAPKIELFSEFQSVRPPRSSVFNAFEYQQFLLKRLKAVFNGRVSKKKIPNKKFQKKKNEYDREAHCVFCVAAAGNPIGIIHDGNNKKEGNIPYSETFLECHGNSVEGTRLQIVTQQ